MAGTAASAASAMACAKILRRITWVLPCRSCGACRNTACSPKDSTNFPRGKPRLSTRLIAPPAAMAVDAVAEDNNSNIPSPVGSGGYEAGLERGRLVCRPVMLLRLHLWRRSVRELLLGRY